jgi:outer membrane protein assembly factor BamB
MRPPAFLLLTLLPAAFTSVASANDWPQFRGPNSTGLSPESNLPLVFSPTQNVVWKTPLPAGHSSPVFSKSQIFLTGYDDKALYIISLDRKSGVERWRKSLPRARHDEFHKQNSPASPSPVTDGQNVYAFFTEFGLISYDAAGKERWRLPLGPFNNPFGMGASPVLSGNTLLMLCDAESGSFFLGINKDTGKQKWRRDRPDVARGFSTPVLNGPNEVLVAGSYQLISYSVATGEPIWWVGGLTWQLKPTPVLGDGVVYVLGWAGNSDTGQQEDVPPFSEALAKWDANKDGKLIQAEILDPRLTKDWAAMDLDRTGAMEERDWRMYQTRRQAVNSVSAIKLGGRGDMTASNVLWRYHKSLPNTPSPVLHNGIVYLVKESGILTALNAKTGEVLKQGRLTGAPGDYYASPVVAGDKLYAISQEGKVVVVQTGADWQILQVNTMNEAVNATPAFLDGRIFLRTHENLYCFAQESK